LSERLGASKVRVHVFPDRLALVCDLEETAEGGLIDQEKKSLVLTTNLPFSDWPTIFPNATTVTALIDRIVHHADIISLEGDSYRRRVAESARKPSRG